MSPDDPSTKPAAQTNGRNVQVKPGKKRPYSIPRLTTYGSIEKLTKSGSGGFADGGMFMASMCL